MSFRQSKVETTRIKKSRKSAEHECLMETIKLVSVAENSLDNASSAATKSFTNPDDPKCEGSQHPSVERHTLPSEGRFSSCVQD